MGFYLRKGLSVGPLRFNLSQSGIGVSTGIKGFRVGTGPRGNYVHMGRGGIYFRQTLPTPGMHRTSRTPEILPQSSSIQFKEIGTAGVTQMVDSSSAALLDEINSKAKTPLIWPWILILSLALLGSTAIFTEQFWLYCLLIPLSCAALVWAVYKDKSRKTVVLFYDLEPHIEQAYQNFHAAIDSLKNCSRVWHIDSQGKINSTYDWKVNAGASSIVKRKTATPDTAPPSYFQCNISIPSIPAGGRRLYFMPDPRMRPTAASA